MLDARLDAALEQRARGAGVVAVVFQRLAHRFGNDGVGRKVHHGVDAVAAQRLEHRGAVADPGDHERSVEHRLAEAARQVVEHHHALAALTQLERDVTADVTGTAGD